MWESVQENLAWMAWTWQVGIFFLTIATLLAAFTFLAVKRPETPRVGVLAIPTTRGDRLFISLLGAAFIHLFWLAFAPADLDLWWATLLSLVYAAAVFRWV
jgi:predicted small integral membrane protein